ncbi:MAG: HAD-IIIC family phosphatase [Polyangiaceae bacterium]
MNRLWSLVHGRLLADPTQPFKVRLRSTAQLSARYLREVGAGLVFLRQCNSVGEGARILGGRPRIDNQGYIGIGARTVLTCEMGPTSLRTGPNGRLLIGESVVMNFGSLVSANLSVRIGDRVSIGQYCLITDTEGADSGPDAVCEPIEIGDDVWLAARVSVLAGAKIGNGSVITAGSIVSSEIPPGVIAGGIPARVLRQLRPGQGREALLQIPEPVDGGESAAEPAAVARPATTCFGRIASDFTVTELERRLNEDDELPIVSFESAPFGQVVSTLLSPAGDRDTLVVWTRPEAAVPAFANLLGFQSTEEALVLSQVDEFCEQILKAATSYKTIFVPTWVMPAYKRGLGMIDSRKGGATRMLTAMNLRLMERLEASRAVFVLNAQRWIEGAGRAAHQPKLWYMGKIPFHGDVFQEAARDIKTALGALAGNARKLLVVDLDDTMWGGIVGDAGWENLRLGGHDSLGESFVDFQHALRDLKQRGILLAVASKNDESVALEAMRCHPEMVLRPEDFVGWRINWQDKARNIADLASQLNLGLQSVVFLDDNPAERARVREQLPEVLVPEWPEDKLLYASTLRALRCFDAPALSREDMERTELYVAESKRSALRVEVGSLDEWLSGLNIVVQVARIAGSNLTRATQLLNKTNQLNLSTKRYTEAELQAWVSEAGHDLWTVSVSDRFGDAGLTGIVGVEYDSDTARISDFVLSCRVMGRQIEETLLHLAVDAAQRRRLPRVSARYLPTKKNKPCLEFFQRSGFSAEGDEFFWDASRPYPCPTAIQLKGASE